MEKSLRATYEKEYTAKISKKFNSIYKLQDEIHNIRVDYDGSNKVHEIIIKFKYSFEIMRYFQFANGSIGYDMFVIKDLLHSLLLYIYIAQEKQLDEKEQGTCSLEIEKDFYLFLNCIYNFKEKYEKFFKIEKSKLNLDQSVLSKEGKDTVLEMNQKYYKLTKNYCLARNHLVHDIYSIKYDVSTNTTSVSYSIFDLSTDQLIEKKSNKIIFDMKDEKMVQLVEDIEKIRKEIVESLADLKNIDLDKMEKKFLNKEGRGIIVTG